ncbi:MAG: hypothetical protein Q9162_001257 [Coniocarpon cinnabarinum]
MAKEPDESLDAGSDADSVSTNSHESANDPNREWDIEEILAEKTDLQTVYNEKTGNWEEQWVKLFLIKWKGWRLPFATWEPLANLVEGKEETLHQWQRQSMLRRRKDNDCFDVGEWEADRDKYRRRKDTKRMRRGLPPIWAVTSDTSDSDEDAKPQRASQKQSRYHGPPRVDESSDEDKPLAEKYNLSMISNADENEDEDEIPLREVKRRRISTDAQTSVKLPADTASTLARAKSPEQKIETHAKTTHQTTQTGQAGDLSHEASFFHKNAKLTSTEKPSEHSASTPTKAQEPVRGTYHILCDLDSLPDSHGVPKSIDTCQIMPDQLTRLITDLFSNNWGKATDQRKSSWINTSHDHRGQLFTHLQ